MDPMKSSSFDLSFTAHLNTYDMMSPTQKRIASAFAYFYKKQKKGEHKNSYPEQETIAGMAKCSTGSVSRFLHGIFGRLCFDKIFQQKKTVPGVHNAWSSNLHTYNKQFFEVLCFLKEKGWVGNWKKMRSFIITQANEDEEVTKEKLGYNKWVVNSKNANGQRPKTQTMALRDSPNPSRGRDKVPTEDLSVPNTEISRRKASLKLFKH